MTSQLVGVLIGGALTLIGGILGQAASHAFATRRERESRREARRAVLADVRLKAILELQEAATATHAEVAMRPALTAADELGEHQARLVARLTAFSVPRSRICDLATDELIDVFVKRVIEAGHAYEAGDHDRAEEATRALKPDVERLVTRTGELLAAERAALSNPSQAQ